MSGLTSIRLTRRSVCIWFGFITCIAVTYLGNNFGHTTEIPTLDKNSHSEISILKSNDAFKKILQIYRTDKQCHDAMLAADPVRSAIYVKGRCSVFLGEYVDFTAILYNGYGKPKYTGGDHLRARLYNDLLGAYSLGTILDHNNGTYTVTVQALWIGRAQLEVEVLYSKETMTTAFRLRRTWDFSNIFAFFSYKNYTDKTTCGPDNETVLEYSKQTQLCNFSYWNNSQQWFCGKPKYQLSCDHWRAITRNWDNFTKGMNTCEQELSKRDRHTHIQSNITLQILPNTINGVNRTTFIETSNTCSNYNKTKLWFKVKPTGYYYNNKWIMLHCKGFRHFHGECFRNKTLLFWGDSTLYQWYTYLKNKFLAGIEATCTLGQGWHRYQRCNFYKYNMTIIFLGHNIPLCGFKMKNLYTFFKSISFEKVIESESRNTDDLLLVLHLYAHIQLYKFEHFAAHISEIKKSLKRILKMKTNIKVFIKLPHAYRRFKEGLWKIKRNDFVGFIFTHIMQTLFQGLLDKIIVLDQKDSTIAKRNLDIHPSDTIVREMVLQFMSYACTNDQ
ncbi:NXPE family member 3-like [Ruditapes philippinarum]|uniref:NXPE family member 3-like n=1 Tax=Ruditapes philippinarum TaxID=129788 RepID=UPI00295B56C6|nr:NXPE family member 3-like [Ruditapes philippinarum]